MRLLLTALVGIILAIGCAHTQSQKANQSADIRFSISSNRALEIEPCGCKMVDLGGVEREWRILEQANRDTLHSIVGGTNLVPEPSLFDNKQLKHYKVRAKYFMEAMNALGVVAMSAGVADYSLGVDFIKALSEQAKFPFLSANLADKTSRRLLLKPYEATRINGHDIVFIGISGQLDRAYPANKTVEILDPVEAVKNVQKKFSDKQALFVVLHSLSDAEQRRLISAVPSIHLLVGGTVKDTFTGARQLSAPTLAVNPTSRGRQVVLMDLSLVPEFNNFYVAQLADASLRRRGVYEYKIRQLKKEKKAANQAEIKRIETVMNAEKSDYIKADSKSAKMRWTIQSINKKFAKGSPNPISDIIKRQHEAIRRLAIENQ